MTLRGQESTAAPVQAANRLFDQTKSVTLGLRTVKPAVHRGVLTAGWSYWEGQVRNGLSGTRHKSRLPGATNSFNNDSHAVCDKMILNLIAIDQRLSGPRKGS